MTMSYLSDEINVTLSRLLFKLRLEGSISTLVPPSVGPSVRGKNLFQQLQAGGELCQAQHLLSKMLLEELDLDMEKIIQSGLLSLHKY